MILEGKGIRLRPATRDDQPAYVRWFTNPEFRHYMGSGEEVLSALNSPVTGEVYFSVETLAGRLIGLVFITNVRTVDRRCEIGWLGIGEHDCWEQGYGTEMVRLSLEFCFGQLGMHQAYIRTAEFNERARRCYGRFFPHEQRHREWMVEDGRRWDEIYFDVTAEEFAAKAAAE